MADVEKMSEAEYAAWLFEHRGELNEGEPVTVARPQTLSSVVTVRFKKDELTKIEQAADKAGLPFTAYIREAALQVSGLSDLKRARSDVRRLTTVLDDLRTALGENLEHPAA